MRTILVSAMGCAPGLGSELGVGWNWVMQLAKTNTVHVVTVVRRREEIEQAIPAEYRSRLTFHYYDLPSGMIRLLPPGSILFYVQCALWQAGIYPLIRRLKRRVRFDFSVHLTFGSIWIPTILPLFDIPFVWGPFGGVEGVPQCFLKSMGGSFYDVAMDRLRYLWVKSIPVNPFIMFSLWRARAILVRTNDTGKAIPRRFQQKVRQVLETAMEKFSESPCTDKTRRDGKVRILSTGRLTPSKNQITAIRALGMLDGDCDFVYTLVGAGPDGERLRKEVRAVGLDEKVHFAGNLSRTDVLRMLHDYDIYLFPSLREGGSWALMEAMEAGLPVVCLDSSGMSVITDEQSAVRLAVTNPEQMVMDMAAAVKMLIDNPDRRKLLGEAARRRIEKEFNWESKGMFMNELFSELENVDKRI